MIKVQKRFSLIPPISQMVLSAKSLKLARTIKKKLAKFITVYMMLNFELLEQLFSTFHDFDLLEMKRNGKELRIKFACYWNEMNDKDSPWMKFTFIFKNCNIIEFEYDKLIFSEHDSEKDVYENIKTQNCQELVDADIYFNRFEIKGDQHWFYCGGNFEKAETVNAIVKLKLNSDSIKIFNQNEIEISIEDYMNLHQKWWDFVLEK